MLEQTIKWFHQIMGHPSEKHLCETLQQHYHHPKLRYIIDRFKCDYCQQHKLSGKGYGLFPEQEMQIAPWEEVGRWMVKVNNRKVEFNVLMCIDKVSNLVKLIIIDNKTSHHIRDKFIQSWLSCYPHPVCCIHNRCGEFIGGTFQWLLHSFDTKDVQSTGKNPQSNLICERMHQTVGNVLRVLLYSNPPQNLTQARDIVNQTLATTMHAMRVTTASTLGSTGSHIQPQHVLECPAHCGLAHNSSASRTVCQ